MSLLTSYTAANDPAFRNKIHMALTAGAIQLIESSGNPEHVAFAKRVLKDTPYWVVHFAFAAAADDATTSASTDNAIRARLVAVFPTFVETV